MNATPLHLLLIEDNPGDARLLREMLRNQAGLPCELEWVETLARGLDRLRAGGIDAVISDLSLPDAAELDAVMRLRLHAPDVPLVVLTGSASDDRALDALRAGAQDYLVKGWADSELIAHTVRYAIERKHTERELARYTRELRARNEQMRSDLQLAHEIQMALLPQKYPTVPAGSPAEQSALRFHHYYESATYLAGDFFDIFPIGDRAVGLFLCDVMGHGVRAALVTAMIRPLVDEFGGAAPPGQVLTEVNRELAAIFQQAGTMIYATGFYLVADIARRRIAFANAGHPTPLRVTREPDEVQPLHSPRQHGPALGLFFDSTYATQEMPLTDGDKLMLFTDGLFETTNLAGEEYGAHRLQQSAFEHRAKPIAELVPALVADVQAYAARAGFADDVCVLGMEVASLP